MGFERFLQLVGANRYELQLCGGRIAGYMGCSMLDQRLSRGGTEVIRRVALGDHHTSHLAPAGVDRSQRGARRVFIHREQHACGVRHLPQQCFANGRVLV